MTSFIQTAKLGLLARSAIYIQQHDLVSRGVIDAMGTAVPIIGLARTPQERREKIVDRVVVIGSVFVLAPLHAWALMHIMAKHYRLPVQFMSLSYSNLQNTQRLKQAFNKLPKQTLQKFTLPTTTAEMEVLRQKIAKAKINMFVPDLTLECLIMGGVGWITNFVSRLLTGQNWFTGELKTTSKQNLNLLHDKEKNYQRTERYRMAATILISTGVPLLLGQLLHKAIIPQKTSGAFFKWFKPKARLFDYFNGYWMSITSLWTVCLVQLSGHLLSARNYRELRENFIREMMLNLICANGINAWMGILKHAIYRPLKAPVKSTLFEMLQNVPKRQHSRIARIGSLTYFSGLLLTSASLAGSILFNNYLTHQKVQKDVKKINTTDQQPKTFVWPINPIMIHSQF